MTRLIDVLRKSSGTTPPLWSTMFAAAIAGDSLVISAGQTVNLDIASSLAYGNIDVYGTLNVLTDRNTDLSFVSMTVYSGGVYKIGTQALPLTNYTHTIRPTGARSLEVAGNLSTPNLAVMTANRAILFMNGSERAWFGAYPSVMKAKLVANINPGDTSMTLSVPVTWPSGTLVELNASKYYDEDAGNGRERVVTSAAVNNSTTVPFIRDPSVAGTGAQYFHHGKLQYVCTPANEDVANRRLSYTPRTLNVSDSHGTVNGITVSGQWLADAVAGGGVTTLDNRGSAGVMGGAALPIKFFGPNDSDWTTHGYGATLGVMGLTTKNRVQGVERYRVGKAGQQGGYPDHDHMRSYTAYGQVGSGTFLGSVDATVNWEQGTATHESSHRGRVIHGTCGQRISNTNYSMCDGHVFLFEDGSEKNGTFEDVFISGNRPISYGKSPVRLHERDDPTNSTGQFSFDAAGPSGLWLTHPQNTVRRFEISGCLIGAWRSFSDRAFGASRDAAVNPIMSDTIEFNGIEAHSSKYHCALMGAPVGYEDGSFNAYPPNNTNPSGKHLYGGTGGNTVLQNVADLVLWKSGLGCPLYVHYVSYTDYARIVLSCLRDYYGEVGVRGVAGGFFRGGIAVCKSLDDAYPLQTPNLFISYHGSLLRKYLVMIPAPSTSLHFTPFNQIISKGAALRFHDYYLDPIDVNDVPEISNVVLGANAGFYGYRQPPITLAASDFGMDTYINTPVIGTQYEVFTAPDKWSQSLTGALKIPANSPGSWFGQTSGWWLFDHPFWLAEITGTIVTAQTPAGFPSNHKFVDNSNDFYGFYDVDYGAGSLSIYQYAVKYTRRASAWGAAYGTWQFNYNASSNFANFKHCGVRHAGFLEVEWKTSAGALVVPTQFTSNLQRFRTRTDAKLYLKVPLSGTGAASTGGTYAYDTSDPPERRSVGVASIAAVAAADTYCHYHDTVNNFMYVCVRYAWPTGANQNTITFGAYNA